VNRHDFPTEGGERIYVCSSGGKKFGTNSRHQHDSRKKKKDEHMLTWQRRSRDVRGTDAPFSQWNKTLTSDKEKDYGGYS